MFRLMSGIGVGMALGIGYLAVVPRAVLVLVGHDTAVHGSPR